MARHYQAFFWLPFETLTWLRRVVPDLGLWIVLQKWKIGGSDTQPFRVEDLRPELFESEFEEAVHLFLGNSDTLSSPVWRHEGGKRQLDFPKSYAIQFVPSILSPTKNVLLEGRMAIMQLDYYEDHDRAARLVALFRRLQAMTREHSDRSQAIFQRLSTGGTKRWNHMLVGKSIGNHSGLRLRHSFNAADGVVFEARPLQHLQ